MNSSTVALRTVLHRVAHPASLALAAALTATILIACAATGYLTRPPSLPGTATPQAILDHWRARAGVPATVMAVQRPDGTRWVGASGTLLRHGDTPATPAARFRIASITKLFVATVVLQLAQDHQLATTDTLDRYVPDFPGADRITVGQLLDHTSGIPDYGQIEGFSDHLRTDRQHRYTTQQCSP